MKNINKVYSFFIFSFFVFNCTSSIDTVGRIQSGFEVGNIAESFSKDYHLIEFYYANVEGEGPRYYLLSPIEDSSNNYVNNCGYIKINKGNILDISPKLFEEKPKYKSDINIRSGNDVWVIWNNEYIAINDSFIIRVYFSEELRDLYIQKDKLKKSFFTDEW